MQANTAGSLGLHGVCWGRRQGSGESGNVQLMIMLADDHMGWVCRREGTCGAGGSSDLQGRGDGGLGWATVDPEGVDGFGQPWEAVTGLC